MDVQKQDRQVIYFSVLIGFVLMILLAFLKVNRVF